MKESYQKLNEDNHKMNETFEQKNNELKSYVLNLINQINQKEKIESNDNLKKKYDDLLFYILIGIFVLIILLFINIIYLIRCLCSKINNNIDLYNIPNNSLDIDKKHNEINIEDDNIILK